jgi:hypothetical protein
VLGFFCTGIGFILRGDKDETYLVLVTFAVIAAHCFSACFVIVRLDIARLNGGKASSVTSWSFALNLLTLPASSLPRLLPGITGFLLVSILAPFYRISLTCPGAQYRLLLLQLSLGWSNDLYFYEKKEEGGDDESSFLYSQ